MRKVKLNKWLAFPLIIIIGFKILMVFSDPHNFKIKWRISDFNDTLSKKFMIFV